MAEYISKKAVLDALKQERKNGNFVFTSKWIKEIMDTAPAADVVEVRHGEWEEERWCDNFQHICSLCHKTVRVHPQSIAYVYCPYCGAKMDGKGEGE